MADPKGNGRGKTPSEEPAAKDAADATDPEPAAAAETPSEAEPEAEAKAKAKAKAKKPVATAAASADRDAAEDEAPASVPLTAAEEHPALAQASAGQPRRGAAWGEPVARFERRWTDLDTKLITGVLIAQLSVLVAWVFLAGLSSPLSAGTAAGGAFRATAGAVAFGMTAWFLARAREHRIRVLATLVAALIGAALAPVWRNTGVEYFDNVKGWLQEGSTLTLMGGLRGVATRLTLWLALLGASLATAMGKHIHVDVVFRFLPVRWRVPAAVVNFAATALVCFAAAWGFFDHLAVQSYGARIDDGLGRKTSLALHGMGEHFFLTRKQIGLDLRSLPHVLTGDRYDRWMSAPAWNSWIKDAGFEGRYPPEQVQGLMVPEDSPAHAPMVISPDGEPTRGMLVHDLNLVFPFGLLVIALRFLLRILLVLSGHIDLDPNAAHQSGTTDDRRP